MIRLKKTMILLLYFLSPLPLIGIVYAFNPAAYETSKGLLPMVLGSIAYTWLLAELVISARPKFIEKYFGLNRFYQFHGTAAIIAIVLSFLHKQLEDAIWGGFLQTVRQIGNIAFILFIALAAISLIFMTGAVIRRIPPLASIRRLLEKGHIVNFRRTVWIHNANVIAVILVFIHVFILSAFYQQNLWNCAIYTVYFMIAFGSYVYHKVLKNSLAERRPYTLTAVKEESADIHTLVFKPERGSVPPFKAGQFVFLRLLGGGVPKEEHPFSITSNPADRSQLSVTIKSVGDYTKAVPHLSPGTHAVFEGPYGVLGTAPFAQMPILCSLPAASALHRCSAF
ncbi:FAD-binding oxidoreductase [Terrilactibacillus sp. S3-3]|nr:FAD-binding oxidoreductase [Terrilactibacillus sp. S3-3]